MNAVIMTNRLLLREFSHDDISRIHEITREKFILKWMPDWELPAENIADIIDRHAGCAFDHDTDHAMLALTLKDNGMIIGMIKYGPKQEVGNEIETAYFISEKFSGKGYMSEAAAAFTEWAAVKKKIPRLIAIVEPENLASQRIIEKSGFSKIRTIELVNSGETKPKSFFYYRFCGRKITIKDSQPENNPAPGLSPEPARYK